MGAGLGGDGGRSFGATSVASLFSIDGAGHGDVDTAEADVGLVMVVLSPSGGAHLLLGVSLVVGREVGRSAEVELTKLVLVHSRCIGRLKVVVY